MLAMLKRISARLSNSYGRRIIDDVKLNKENLRCQIKEIKLSDRRPITPRLNDKTDSGKTHLQDLARWWRTSQRVDIQKISQFYWGLFEKTRFLCFYIIKSMARKGYFGPKSDFRGSKIPPRGASST